MEDNNYNNEAEDDEDSNDGAGIKLFKTSNKPIKCTLFLNDIENDNLIKSIKDNKAKYLINDKEILETTIYNDKKRKRSLFIKKQIENSTNETDKQLIENEKKEMLNQLKQSLVEYNDIIKDSKTIPPIPNKKGQIIYSTNNQQDNTTTTKPTTIQSLSSQYNYINIHLSKPLFDQVYEIEKGIYIKDKDEDEKEEKKEEIGVEKTEETSVEKTEEKEETSVEKKEEIIAEKENNEDEDRVNLFPYYPKANVYNIIDDNEENIKPYSIFNHRYKYHNTNTVYYNIYKDSHEPGTNTTIIDPNKDILTPQIAPEKISNKKLKKKKFFKRG